MERSDGRRPVQCPRCGGGGPGSRAAHGRLRAREEPTWRVTRLHGQVQKTLAGLPNGVTIRFEGGRLQGFGGCNQLAGSYSIDRDRVTLGPLAGTMMACPPPAMAVETAFKNALTGALRSHVVEGRLTLASESDADPRLAFEAVPPPRLEGTTWEVNGFNNGRHAVVGPLTGTTLTVSFQDGMIVGHAGCNSFRTTYTREGDRLAIGPAAVTRKVCAGKGIWNRGASSWPRSSRRRRGRSDAACSTFIAPTARACCLRTRA